MFLQISKNSQENTYARVSSLIKLEALGFRLYARFGVLNHPSQIYWRKLEFWANIPRFLWNYSKTKFMWKKGMQIKVPLKYKWKCLNLCSNGKISYAVRTQCLTHTPQKMKFSIKDFFINCYESHRKLRFCSHLLKTSLMENFIFCAETYPLRWFLFLFTR